MDPITWTIILLSVGFLVVFLELFIPSAGVLGVLATVLLVSGVVVAFFHSVYAGAIALLITVVSIPVLLAIMVNVWPHTPLGRRILLGKMDPKDVMPTSEQYTEYKQLVGQLGIAKTKMLPSGIVMINDRKYDALSDGFAIEAGQPIKVSAVKGTRIIVTPYEGNMDDPQDLPVRDRDVLAQPIEGLGLEELDLETLDGLENKDSGKP
jgi:membrane-bound serine protease (ClpP class)